MAEGVPRPPWSRKRKLSVLAAIAAVGIAVALLLPQIAQVFGQPNIRFVCQSMGGGCFGDMDFGFAVVNSGVADGFVNIEFLIDGIVVANDDYFVPAGTFFEGMHSVFLNDCDPHTPSMRIAGMWKG